ncbi:hypothetical protein A7X93_00500 [Stenotrophomonas maltophilia]|uniref:hypothetical protein n=1 Tax=Stenotrophomonas maltophilia TaxID=40324 RepID=UPI000DA73D9E|nr:hypothetical protein [Stenotrophomonas maltophilia]PZT35120.1 hypothetical protein A7X93_00500 [Stenotrophomonas maltophilia]
MDGQGVKHSDLVKIAGRWLRNTAGCSVVLEELCAATGNGENPDAIGWYTGRTMLVECKVSRSDFLADRKKRFRARPEHGLGLYRYFMAPKGLITVDELPARWGLLEVSGSRVAVAAGKRPKTWADENDPWAFPERFAQGETQMLLSAMQRIKVRVGAADFHEMLHERLMRPVVAPARTALPTASAWGSVIP